jgi:hypothetical protein
MDNSQPSAWRASDESGKAQFQPYSYTGAYKQLRGAPTAVTAYKELLFNLVSDGHVVLRNIRLTTVANQCFPDISVIQACIRLSDHVASTCGERHLEMIDCPSTGTYDE